MDEEIKSLFKKGIKARRKKFNSGIICGIIVGPGMLLWGLISWFSSEQNLALKSSRNIAGLIGVGIAGCLLTTAFFLINRYQNHLQGNELLALDFSTAPEEIILKIHKSKYVQGVVRTPPFSCVIFRRKKADMILPLPIDKARRLFFLMKQKYPAAQYNKIDEYESI